MADGTISKIQLPDNTIYDVVDNTSGYMTGMTILSYGSSTWQNFIDAYSSNKVVYCRASSNSNPASGSQTRLAFMAYVNNTTTPTEVEFQYYRSVSTHTASQQGDQVYVYKLNKTNGWSVTVREASVKVVAGTGLGGTYSNGTMTLTGPTKVSDLTNDSGFITTETDPTVPSWAKQATKPTYTYSEVGAAASSHGHDIVTSGSSTTSGGFMSQADKQKLDGIAEGATANVGTITGITMNGSSKGTSGVVDLGTVITEHQDISGKADKSSTVTNVAYDTNNKKITKTINGTTSDVVSVATLKTDLGSMPASDVYAWAKEETKPTYTASEVGLGNVGNFKAVSTVANQGLTDTEKSNARTNIGAGTSNLTIGTTGTTAAAGNHTHTTSLASDTGTSSITLASAGVYKLTAGETSVIFKMPTIPTVDYPVTSVAGKTGAVTLEASDVGLGNVGNFKAVSTVANQGLTTTEKSNARTNIGAGTSNLEIGTTSTTAAAGDHTHTLSMATSYGTSSIDLEANTKYQLTAGGSTYIFKTPAGGSSTDSYHTSGSWSGLTYTATAVGNAGTLAFTIPTGTTSTTVSAGNHTHTFASLTSKPTTLSGYGITDGTAANHTHPYDNNYKFVLNTSDALYTSINNMGWTSDVII